MGNAVDTDNIARELKRLSEAGLGTAEITPIYGLKEGGPERLPYLGPRWMGALGAAVSEAQKLGMDVDMVTGTGWCFGGPWVQDQDANALAVVKTFDVPAGGELGEKFDPAKTQALVAYAEGAKPVDLKGKIREDGSVDWKAGVASRVYAISQRPSGVKVKRPAPGGEGWMLNLLYPDAMGRYLSKFDAAFAGYRGPMPHAQFHDSYEYKSDWAPDFFEQFEKRRGYRLQDELPSLFGGVDDRASRVKCDYRQTASELIEESIARWTAWAHKLGSVSRNQAHGSPGNWLDVYAASDVPETEMFNKDRDILVSKFASSAAHVTGKKMTSSESGTWVAEHFSETLASLKSVLDDLYLSGVNRAMYHGTAYSPEDAPWPGWCFYASAQFNPRNAIWRDARALNDYATRVQGAMQAGRPDNDVLVYWPIHDLWSNAKDGLVQLTVHGRDWSDAQPIGRTARALWDKGFAFDYVSDKQLQSAQPANGAIALGGSAYRAVVVPASHLMPLDTRQKLQSLASAGARVIFVDSAPSDVPGLAALDARRAEFIKIAAPQGSVVPAAQLESALVKAGAKQEKSLVAFPGVRFVRRAIGAQAGESFYYFVANRGEHHIDGWAALAVPFSQVAIMDPASGRIGAAQVRRAGEKAEVRLQLEPGEALVLRAGSDGQDAPDWPYWEFAGAPAPLEGPWDVKFIEGGPELPAEVRTDKLASWTSFGGQATAAFAGTARYTKRFDAPGPAPRWGLDLGRVAQSARVRLNGRDLGTLFAPPFRVQLDGLKPRDNLLEIEVTSTSANRLRDLDRRGAKWKIFDDINIVGTNYKPLDASAWPVAECGLLGPVTLRPLAGK